VLEGVKNAFISFAVPYALFGGRKKEEIIKIPEQMIKP
jgi:hypothetical protein